MTTTTDDNEDDNKELATQQRCKSISDFVRNHTHNTQNKRKRNLPNRLVNAMENAHI